ncbi:unnamed protein product [Echinostoma caproni]|uniref:Leishmanolysin-like peptidase n=1 Tax=Echinostoma caproni TaxID=27848 RepID=A0A183AB64_9TREM|nr:unnamed protein product [Echinostoma caproni]
MTAANYTPSGFRVTPIYTSAFNGLKNSEEFKEKIVVPAIGYWSEALKVKNPPIGPLKIARDCEKGRRALAVRADGSREEICVTGCASVTTCYDIPIPSEYLDKCTAVRYNQPLVLQAGGPGASNTDYLLLVDARMHSQCDQGTLAFATVCQLDSKSNSPHTLTEVERTWKSVKGTYQLKRVVLRTPKLLEVAREHFGCEHLDGVEMENQGGSGTAAAHFEKRVVLNEAMAGSVGFETRVSKLTLAYFYDSGHCLNYANAYGSCNIRRFAQPLPPMNQYFAAVPGQPIFVAPLYGGADELADYCPFMTMDSHWFTDPVIAPDFGLSSSHFGALVNRELQAYGPDSVCFAHDPKEPWRSYQCDKGYQYKNVAASCYRYKCVPEQGLIVMVDRKEYQCPVGGGSIPVNTVGSVAYVSGRLICPECAKLCQVRYL